MNGSWAYYGVMLKAYNETQKSKTFASANRSTYTPSVIVNYTDHISGDIYGLRPRVTGMPDADNQGDVGKRHRLSDGYGGTVQCYQQGDYLEFQQH